MKRLGLRALLLLGLPFLGEASCASIAPPQRPVSALHDAVAGLSARPPPQRILDTAFHHGVLWLRGADASLAAVDMERGDVAYPLAAERVLGLHRTLDDRLWILSVTDVDVHVWERGDGGFTPVLAMAAPASPVLALADVAGRPVLLTSRAIFFVDEGGELRTASLDQELKLGRVPHLAFAATTAGVAYAGKNSGEWGGALYRIGLASGAVELVRRVDKDDLCAGPLNPDCDPITSLIPDPDAPACVLVGVGLRHFGDSGRLLRVCGTNVNVVDLPGREEPPAPVDAGGPELQLAAFFGEAPARAPKPKKPAVFPEAEEPSSGEGLGDICSIDPSACPAPEEPAPKASQAIFGLSRTRRGYWMVTGDSLFYVQAGRAQRVELPLLQQRGSVQMGWTPGALTVVTDANWGASVSGYTPLVAATSPEGALGADDLAQYPALRGLGSEAPEGTCWSLQRGAERSAIQRGPERALCFRGDRCFIKYEWGWWDGPVRWSRGADTSWIASLSARESVQLWLAHDRALALARYAPSRTRRRTLLRRVTGAELAELGAPPAP